MTGQQRGQWTVRAIDDVSVHGVTWKRLPCPEPTCQAKPEVACYLTEWGHPHPSRRDAAVLVNQALAFLKVEAMEHDGQLKVVIQVATTQQRERDRSS